MLKLIILLCVFLLFPVHIKADRQVNPNQTYSYIQMKHDLVKLAKTYNLPLIKIGESEFGRDLLAVKVGEGQHSILLNGSHHGREWLTTNVLMNMVEEYAAAYQQGNSIGGYSTGILDTVSIWFVPMVNPDGVMIQQKGIEQLPFLMQEVYIDMNQGESDFKRWKANGLGIDLNRQYPAGWESIKGDQPSAAYSHYKGQEPLQAKEARALARFTKKKNPLITASYHTSGHELYWYYYNKLLNLHRDFRLVNHISKVTGYKVSYPSFNAVGGGYSDWFIQEFQRPAITLELSYLVKETSPPLSAFQEEWKRNRAIGLLIADEAIKFFINSEK
ncbi:M14 family metallocarboxypeptidase [Metabacillus herbersteinensis]|uniref:M14 family metallocarboxypeptidase n=1 Tax=Metabacillus herbersteinensis TaxID=283816 RepID=A0ABV6GEQ1_9BACI